MTFALLSHRAGANLPSDSAPPAPTALWHIAQLVRKICMPLAASPCAGSMASSEGMAGPGPSEATYAASWATCSSVNCGGLASACGPLFSMGMRPVPTWKSTEAAPTPISDGASCVPSAFMPWHVAQFALNRSEPVSMSLSLASAAPAGLGASAAYRPPVTSRASRSSTAGADRWCLRAASAFTDGSSSRESGCWDGLVARPAPCPSGAGRVPAVRRSAQEVDHREQRDPHDVDEVPVVRHDDGGGRLVVTE